MRIPRQVLLTAIIIFAACCQRRELSESRRISLAIDSVSLKTVLNPARTALQWCEGDRISVYNDSDGSIQTAVYQSGGSISVPVPLDAARIKATYPETSGSYDDPLFSFPLKQTQASAGVLNGENYPLIAQAPISGGSAALHFAAVGSAFALNVFNPKSQGEMLRKVSVKPSQRTQAVQVSLTEPFEISPDKPSDKRTCPDQVYACLEKGEYSGIVFTVLTDKFQYSITSNQTVLDLINHDFFVVNLDLANLKAFIEAGNEGFEYEIVDVTLPSAGFVELIENLPEEQIQNDTIPDFSTVGYHWGEAGFPDYSTVVQLPSPSGGDDTQVIQSAIDNASEGTVIQFQQGRYIVDGLIIVDKSGIILRGDGDRQTEIFARGTVALDDVDPTSSGVFYKPVRHLINVGLSDKTSRTKEISRSISAITVYNMDGRLIESHGDAWYIHGTGLNSGSSEVFGNGSPIVEDAFCGSRFVTVKDASSFNVGDNVAVYRPGTTNWIHDIKMDNIIKDKNDVGSIYQWTPGNYSIYWERTVKAVVGDRLYFDAPLVMSITGEYGGGEVMHYSRTRIRECGIENFKIVSDYNPDRNSTAYGVGDVYHADNAITIYAAEHCWVKNVETHFFSVSAVDIESEARNITVEGCDQKEPAGYRQGGLRYAFHISGGQMCLMKDCTCDDDRHQFVTAMTIPGPNVFLRCKATNALSVLGPHQRWATGTLYDNVSTDNGLAASDAGNYGTGQGWQGTNQVFWCCTANAFRVQSPWVTGKNYVIGCKFTGGSPATISPYRSYPTDGIGPDGSYPVNDYAVNGYRVDGVCRQLLPGEDESLYDSQLKARLSSGDKVSSYVAL